MQDQALTWNADTVLAFIQNLQLQMQISSSVNVHLMLLFVIKYTHISMQDVQIHNIYRPAVNTCIYIYIYIYVYTDMHAHIYIYTHTNMHVCLYTRTHA
jgi:hypothetical protein